MARARARVLVDATTRKRKAHTHARKTAFGRALDHVLDLTLHGEHEKNEKIEQQYRPENRDIEDREEAVRKQPAPRRE